MKLNPFKKEEENKKPEDPKEEKIEEHKNESPAASESFSGVASTGAYRVLSGFYVSEKSSMGNAMNQYVFRVFKNANKSEVKKEVSKLFNVKVKSVKVLNMPEKRRDFGKHPGEKSGFKKAIVVLEKGYTIGQAKP